MERSWRLGLGILLLLGILSGCASQKAATGTKKDATAQPSETAAQQAKTGADQSEVQNHKEKQLVFLFQALLQMDSKNGLTLSRKQAEDLLPLVRKSRDEGQLSPAEQKTALALLTPEQSVFYTDLSNKAKERMKEDRKRFEKTTPSERDKLIEDFKKQRDKHPEGKDAPPPPHNPGPSADNEGPGPGKGFGKSMEQQLIDLLESKLTK